MPAGNTSSGVATKGIQLQRGTADSSGTTFAAIAEIMGVGGPNKTREFIELTNEDSPNDYEEFQPAYRNGGEVTLECNFTIGGYVDLNDDFENDDIRQYKIVYPDTGATEIQFWGFVTALGNAAPFRGRITTSVTFKVTGQPTLSS